MVLELWADFRSPTQPGSPCPEGATAVLVSSSSSSSSSSSKDGGPTAPASSARLLELDAGTRLLEGGKLVGAAFACATPMDVQRAMAAVGSVDWVVLLLEDWIMIPCENLIGAATGGPTRIAALIQDPGQVQGAAFALQLGVDALLLDPSNEALWTAARKAHAIRAADAAATGQRAAQTHAGLQEEAEGRVALVEAVVEAVEAGGVGDRVCLDLIQLLQSGEGVLVGSSALGLALVQAEVLSTDYVPPRPFRVNAGPVHSYVLMADGRAEYLAGVRAGDKVRVVDQHGGARGVTVGRCKIESRPVLQVSFSWPGPDGEGSRRQGTIFLQQAETVRLVSPPTGPMAAPVSKPVTDLQPGDRILVRVKERGTHVGREIDAKVVEK